MKRLFILILGLALLFAGWSSPVWLNKETIPPINEGKRLVWV